MTTNLWQPGFGAQIEGDGVAFRVWAPKVSAVEVALHEPEGIRYVPMQASGDGRFEARIPGIGAGARYAYRLDGGDARPDPYSRFQPEGVHGPSEVVDPTVYEWNDGGWRGISPDNLAIYELHVGTMTREGTFASLIGELAELKRLGVTAIELMPVAQFPGRWNWGYDGVNLFAPFNAYGRPDDLRRLVDAAHQVGLGVILDVVYNHLGPEGNYLREFADAYFSERHETAWGAGLNWDGPGCGNVRRYAIDNACHWIAEYHIDGLRLDATHAIIDDSEVHIVQELSQRVREVAGERQVVVIAEDGRHEIIRVRPVEAGGEGLDAVWADDFHHELRVHLTNAHENYFAAYEGSTADIAEVINAGFSPVTTQRRDITPISDEDPASALIFCIQNHDQVGNRPFGDRLHHLINADRYAVASALLLFAPQTPLLFMGQEFAVSTPFLYFTDHPEDLGRLVTEGRRNEFAGFREFDNAALRDTIPDPQAESTFLASKLSLHERWQHAGIYRLYQRLLEMRATDPVMRNNLRTHTRASALTAEMVAVHRWFGTGQRLLIANFGSAAEISLRETEALLPVAGRPWHLLLATSQRRYGGSGNRPVLQGIAPDRMLSLPARSASIWAVGD